MTWRRSRSSRPSSPSRRDASCFPFSRPHRPTSCRQRGRRVSRLLFQNRRDRRRDGRRSTNGRQRLGSGPHANSAGGTSSPHANSAGGTRQRRRRQAGGRSRRDHGGGRCIGAAKENADKIVAEAEKWAEKATKEAADKATEAADTAAQALSPAVDAVKRWWEQATRWFEGESAVVAKALQKQ